MSLSRRQFVKHGALLVPTIFIPRLIRAQSILSADGLAAFIPQPTGGGGGGGGGDITTGLVALYSLDDNAANTQVADSSGNGYAATSSTNTSTLHATGKVGTGAFLLNGSSQSVSFPSNVPLAISAGTECTLACWFKGSAVQSAIRMQTDNSNYILLGWGTSSPSCIISSDGGTSGVALAGVQDGNWHHIALTWRKNTTNGFKVYVDKSLSAQRNSANANLPTLTGGNAAAIGCYTGGSEFTNGTVDDARVYSRALEATDIAALP